MSGPSPEELIEAAHWLRESEEELRVAERLVAEVDLPGRIACFHAHLAAEKALRALQIRRGVPVRKTHNLVGLAEELPSADAASFEDSDLDALNPWTIDGRYPEDHRDVSHQAATAVLEAARRVISAVKAGW